MKYYKFFFQKETDGSPVMESGEDFDIYEVESKFYGCGEAKELANRDWCDEHGDDEFIPDEIKLKAQNIEVKFGYKGDKFSANAVISRLHEYLRNGGMMKIYDEYNHIGRKHVRFVGISDDAELVRNDDDGDILIFTVKLKANDPATDVLLNK
jgi:hypothetical protein